MPTIKVVETAFKAVSALATAGLAIIKLIGYTGQLKSERKEDDSDLDFSSLD